MGRTLENKQKIVTEIKSLLNDSEMALVLDYKGLTIKEMSDLRSRLQTTKGICKVTKNSLMRKAIDGCLLYTSPSPRDGLLSRMPSSA